MNRFFAVLLMFGAWYETAHAAHQSDTFSPLLIGQAPFSVTVRPAVGSWQDLPTLHSFVKAQWDGKWVVLGGRTNGMHGFSTIGMQNFPTASQNWDVWVIDPATGQTWNRSLTNSGYDPNIVHALSTTNAQSVQLQDRLLVVGGYGATPQGGLRTFDTLTSLNLPSLIQWVQHPQQDVLPVIHQIQDPLLQVTGGALEAAGDRLHLVLGQDFQGGYVPGKNGVYTEQVRSFRVHQSTDGIALVDVSVSPSASTFRRRDLNVLPSYHQQSDGSLQEEITVLSGVFTKTDGIWTAPIQIDPTGTPTMQPVDQFRQSVNNYHSAKLGLYSAEHDMFAAILLGGITLEAWNPQTEQLERDDAMPFTNQIAAVVRNHLGDYEQHWLGEMPALFDDTGKQLRFGANAEFFPAPNVPRWPNGLINLDAVTSETVLGHVFGGIVANGPHTRGVAGVTSAASDQVFEVIFRPVPEPTCYPMLCLVVLSCCRHLRNDSRAKWLRRTEDLS